MILSEELIAIGRYNKPHGVHGEISATMQCGSGIACELKCLVSEIEGLFVPFYVAASRPKTDMTLLLTLDGINSEDEARQLVNHEIFALKREWDEVAADEMEDEVPVAYLQGFDVVLNGQHAKLVDIDDSTANVLLVVETDEGKQVLVPAVDEMIESVDIEGKTITLNVPQELIELNG